MNIKKLEKLNEIEFMLTFRNIWETEVTKYLLYNDVNIGDSVAKTLFTELKNYLYEYRNRWAPKKMRTYEMLHKLVIYDLNFSHNNMKEFKKRSQKFKNVRFKRYLLNILSENSKNNKETDWRKLCRFHHELTKLV